MRGEQAVSQSDFILTAGSSEGEEKGILGAIDADGGMLFDILMPVGIEGALMALLFSTGMEEVVGKLAGNHDSSCSCIEPALIQILLLHYSIYVIISLFSPVHTLPNIISSKIIRRFLPERALPRKSTRFLCFHC